jgi:pentatricopeptide repeat protein
VKLLRPTSGKLYGVLLSELEQQGRGPLDRVLEAMAADERLEGTQWSVEPWRRIIKMYGALDERAAAAEAFERMRTRGAWHHADVASANVLLGALRGSPAAAFAKLEELKRWGMTPNRVTYNVLLSSCMRCHDLPRAEMALSLMEAQDVKPDAVTYNILVKVACYCGDVERVAQVLPRMRAAGVEPTPKIWGSLMVALGKVVSPSRKASLVAGLVGVCFRVQ